MKKSLLIIGCTMLLMTGTTQNTYAGGAGGQALEITQLANNALLIPTDISTAATALATQGDFVFNTVLGPIANALISNMLQNVSNNMISWISGGMEGNSLIQSPEAFIKKQGLTEVRKVLTALPQDNPLANGIFKSIAGGYADKDLNTAITEITRSNIPNIIQKNICSDAQLTALAIERVASADGKYDKDAMRIEKEYLYGYAGCNRNPNTNQDLAIKLMDLYKQRPELGGGAAFLALTSGDNDFVKATQVESLVREKVETAKKLAENELFQGLGTISQTKCSVDLQEDAAGNTFCPGEMLVVNPGKAVQDALNLASGAGVQRLIAITGSGSLSSVLTGFIQQTLFAGLNKGIASLASSGGAQNTSTGRGVAPAQKDLAGAPERKSELVGSIYAQFDNELNTIQELEKVVGDYDDVIADYRTKIESPKMCFDLLIERGVTSRGDGRVENFFVFYENRLAKITQTQETLSSDTRSILGGRDLIAETKNKMDASQSSQEISDIYNTYTATYRSEKFPTMATVSQRKQNFSKDKSDASSDNEADRQLDTCRQIERESSGSAF